MKNINLTKSLFAAVLLASPLVQADQKYPAADFQPEVVYQDKELIAQGGKSETAPAVAKKEVKEVEDTATDSKYPAANFQPQVIYSDEGYKHNESLKPVSKVAEKTVAHAVTAEAPVAESTQAEKKQDSSITYILGLVGLMAVGGFLYKKQAGCGAKNATPARPSSTVAKIANTGVARYLNKVSGTGVSRYIEQKVKTTTPATGVAKYMAKQVVAAKTATVQTKTTGVEKYVRDRG